jgi:hypothetical protein
MTYESERYEVEVQDPEFGEERTNHSDLDEAMEQFYRSVADNYSEPSHNVCVHDLVAGRTLCIWEYNETDEVGKVMYDTPTQVLGN